MMSPEERNMLSALFARVRDASGQPRDAEAEAFIADAVRQQPYAPYLLAQAVLVQEQALKAAAERIEELEAQQSRSQPQETGSFLGGLFGGRPAEPQRSPWTGSQRSSVPPAGAAQGGPWSGQGGRPERPGMFGQGGQQAGGPQGFGQPQQGQGGGFLKGALGAAAGVAGGMLLANSLQGLFKGDNNPLGIAGDTKAAGSEAAATPAAATDESITGGVFGNDAPSYDNASHDDGGYDDGGGDFDV
jgi:hypothetical protein